MPWVIGSDRLPLGSPPQPPGFLPNWSLWLLIGVCVATLLWIALLVTFAC